MIVIDHHTNEHLDGMELRQLIRTRKELGNSYAEVLGAINTLVRPLTHLSVHQHRGDTNEEVMVPEVHTAAIACLRNNEPCLTIEKAFLISTPRQKPDTIPYSFHRYSHKEDSASRVADRTSAGPFVVPVEHALPLSYEAQVDIVAVTGKPRPHQHVPGHYAPLFTSTEMTPEEKAALGWLTPSENNSKVVVQRRLEEKHRLYRTSDPNARRAYNEPKRMPNLLHKKCAENFVPEAYSKPTKLGMYRNAEKRERMTAAVATINNATPWY